MEKHSKINIVERPKLDDNGLIKVWLDAGTNIQLLTISGIAGAVFRTIMSPEKAFWRKVMQGFAGALSAIFLGGFLASFLNNITDFGVYSYLASGFILGTAGEVAVKKIQEKLLEKKE
ncbi:MAG: hypothetical protein ACRCXK_00400 [Wohlfahrtiimonas sp.]